MRTVASLVTIILLFAAVGCGNNMPKTIKVTGKITFDGQPPPESGLIYFLPSQAAEGFPSRPGSGDFAKDGSYTTTTFAPNDGLMPGKYKAYIECWSTPPNMEGKPVKSFVPKKYQNSETSGFEVEISLDSGAKQFNFDVVTK